MKAILSKTSSSDICILVEKKENKSTVTSDEIEKLPHSKCCLKVGLRSYSKPRQSAANQIREL